MSWRLVEFPVESYPDQASFITQTIFEARIAGDISNTVVQYLHQKEGIMMGRQLDPDLDINFERAKSEGIPVKRSLTPGGAMGNEGLVFTAAYLDADAVGGRDAQGVLDTYMAHMADSYSETLGLDITYSPRNDFNFGDKKIGLGGCYMDKGFVQFRTGLQTTPLDHKLMSEILTPPSEKYSDKDRDTNVETRATSLQEAMDEEISPIAVRDASIEAIESAFDVNLEREGLTAPEFRNVVDYRQRYDTDEWLWGNSIYRTFGSDIAEQNEVRSNVRKIPEGPTVRARLLVNTETSEIEDVSITGYFHGLSPVDVIDRLEDQITGATFEKTALRERLERFFTEDRYVSKLSVDDLLEILIETDPIADPFPDSQLNPFSD